MALIPENLKQNLANQFVANFDENGDGTGINGQPLQVSEDGNLYVSIAQVVGNSIPTLMNAYREDGQPIGVRLDSYGALNQGGVNIQTLQEGKEFQLGYEYANISSAVAGINSLKQQILDDIESNGFSRMYNYKENIFSHGSGINVIISCWGGN